MAGNVSNQTSSIPSERKIGVSLRSVVELAQNGDPEAFAQLYSTYKPQVLALCVRMTKNRWDSEDLAQDIFLQVFRKISSFRGDAVFGTWLYAVARNLILMHIRKRSVETISGDISDFENDARACLPLLYCKAATAPLHRLALKRAVSMLPPHRRAIFVLHDIEGLNHREVSGRLGVETGTSKSQLHHAHVALRAEVWHQPVSNRYVSSSGSFGYGPEA